MGGLKTVCLLAQMRRLWTFGEALCDRLDDMRALSVAPTAVRYVELQQRSGRRRGKQLRGNRKGQGAIVRERPHLA